MKEKMSFRAWERMMQEIPGFSREAKGTVGQTLGFSHETGKMEWLSPAQVSMQKAVDHLKQAEVNFNRADPAEDPEYVDIATLELEAARKRVDAEVRRAKNSRG